MNISASFEHDERQDPLVPQLGLVVYQLAEAMGMGNERLGNDLRTIAHYVRQWPYVPPNEGLCPYCGPETQARWHVIEWLCPADREYQTGARAIWKCPRCGEMEVR